MQEGPVIARAAALIGDPARANMLTALMDGRALTVSELALAANVALQTASGHLAKLEQAGLVSRLRQGRHSYIRLSGPDVALVLEGLMDLAARTGAARVRPGPRDAALREARVCYDHLAGARGVALFEGLVRAGLLRNAEAPALTRRGRELFESWGLDIDALSAGRRPLCRRCLDWSERRAHLGGALGAAILAHLIARRWARRGTERVIAFTPEGRKALAGLAFAAA
jgi:DNA-binding transcriptional ArsR family regulator